jgi:CheY-like chemotaxis protein
MEATTHESRISTAEARRVLLVEDDVDQRELIGWMLRAEGLDVLEAGSGVELLEWIGRATSSPARTCFDVIVSDVNMPDLTAMDVLAGWRYGPWPAPLVLMTASLDARMRSEAEALGASILLVKPVRPEELRGALEQALARSRAQHGRPDPSA